MTLAWIQIRFITFDKVLSSLPAIHTLDLYALVNDQRPLIFRTFHSIWVYEFLKRTKTKSQTFHIDHKVFAILRVRTIKSSELIWTGKKNRCIVSVNIWLALHLLCVHWPLIEVKLRFFFRLSFFVSISIKIKLNVDKQKGNICRWKWRLVSYLYFISWMMIAF